MIIGCVLQYLKRFDVSSTGKQSLFSAMTIPTATIARPCLATPECAALLTPTLLTETRADTRYHGWFRLSTQYSHRLNSIIDWLCDAVGIHFPQLIDKRPWRHRYIEICHPVVIRYTSQHIYFIFFIAFFLSVVVSFFLSFVYPSVLIFLYFSFSNRKAVP